MTSPHYEHVFGDAPPPVQKKAGPGILASLGWIILYFLLQFMFSIVTMIGFNVVDFRQLATFSPAELNALYSSADFAIATLWSLLLSGAAILLILWVVYGRGDKMLAILPQTKSALPLPRLIILAVGLLALSYGFNALYETYVIPGIEGQKAVTDMLKAVPGTPAAIGLMFFTIAFLAPIVEEILFRWGLQNALMRHMGPWAAIGLSALAFAAVHMQPYAIPELFLMGAVFGYLYYRSGSIRTNIILHIVNNGLATILLVLAPHSA